MFDPISLVACVAAIVSAIASGGHLIRRLWTKLKGSFGRSCTSIRYLQNMDQNRLSGAISSILTYDPRLRQAAQKRYIGYTSSGSDAVELLSDSDISDCSDCSV